MSDSPEEIQEDIERTRQDMRENVDALQEKVSIKGAASRTTDRMKESVSSMKDTIMGTADSGVSSAKDAVHSAGESAGQLPAKARRTTKGNPLAVGLGAFAVGWLIGSLIPASEREREAVAKVDLSEPVQEVVSHAQEKGKQALHEVAEEAKSGAQQVAESVQS